MLAESAMWLADSCIWCGKCQFCVYYLAKRAGYNSNIQLSTRQIIIGYTQECLDGSVFLSTSQWWPNFLILHWIQETFRIVILFVNCSSLVLSNVIDIIEIVRKQQLHWCKAFHSTQQADKVLVWKLNKYK